MDASNGEHNSGDTISLPNLTGPEINSLIWMYLKWAVPHYFKILSVIGVGSVISLLLAGLWIIQLPDRVYEKVGTDKLSVYVDGALIEFGIEKGKLLGEFNLLRDDLQIVQNEIAGDKERVARLSENLTHQLENVDLLREESTAIEKASNLVRLVDEMAESDSIALLSLIAEIRESINGVLDGTKIVNTLNVRELFVRNEINDWPSIEIGTEGAYAFIHLNDDNEPKLWLNAGGRGGPEITLFDNADVRNVLDLDGLMLSNWSGMKRVQLHAGRSPMPALTFFEDFDAKVSVYSAKNPIFVGPFEQR